MKLQNLIRILMGIVCIGLLPRAQAVSPPPPGLSQLHHCCGGPRPSGSHLWRTQLKYSGSPLPRHLANGARKKGDTQQNPAGGGAINRRYSVIPRWRKSESRQDRGNHFRAESSVCDSPCKLEHELFVRSEILRERQSLRFYSAVTGRRGPTPNESFLQLKSDYSQRRQVNHDGMFASHPLSSFAVYAAKVAYIAAAVCFGVGVDELPIKAGFGNA